jgi:ABC-type sugar transport system substrate-binding protein
VPKTILVVLVGSTDEGAETDAYQLLQQEAAIAEAKNAAVNAEIVFAPGFDHLRVIRKRLGDPKAAPVDAVVVEPGSVASTGLLLKDLKGKTGLVLLNAWSAEVEHYASGWGANLPFGTVSVDHTRLGQVQGKQVATLLPQGGHVLCVTGPQRSSAAVERLEGLKSGLRQDVTLYETGAGGWTESDGAAAFDSWYGLFKTRNFKVDVIAAQSDELAMGARNASEALANPAHREMFSKAHFLGVDACPAFGRKLVDQGKLRASVTTPANTAEAIRALRRFWESGQPLPLKAFTDPTAYPPSSAR